MTCNVKFIELKNLRQQKNSYNAHYCKLYTIKLTGEIQYNTTFLNNTYLHH